MKIEIFFAIILFSCCHNKSDNSLTKSMGDSMDNKENLISDVESKNKYSITDDPDTLLAIFLYENYNNNTYAGFYEEYQRWVLEYSTIKSLILKIFSSDPNIDSIILVLDGKKKEIVKLSRSEVLSIYEDNDVLAGPDFEFLCQIKDEIAKDLIKKIKINPKAPKDEKDYAIEMENQYFK